jgi:hypothetical protein
LSLDGYSREEVEKIVNTLRHFEWNATVGEGTGCLPLSSEKFIETLVSVLHECNFPVKPAALYRRIAAKVAAIERKSMVIEKTPHHIHWVERILTHLPDAKFILLYCGPFDFIRVHRCQKDLIFHPLACSFMWRQYKKSFDRVSKTYHDRCVAVYFDDLLRSPEESVMHVLKFLDVPYEPLSHRMQPSRVVFSEEFYNPLKPADIFWMKMICGALIPPCEAKNFPVFICHPSIMLTLFSFPLWLLRALWKMRNEHHGSMMRYLLKWLQ